MVIDIFAVLHGDKINTQSNDAKIVANPPMSEKGLIEVHDVIPAIAALRPFHFVFSSRLARANDTASAICIPLDLNWQTHELLGQHGSLQNGESVLYPGYEHESYPEWLENTEKFLSWIGKTGMRYRTPSMKILIFTHRPIVACLLGIASRKSSIPDDIVPEDIMMIARGKEITQKRLYHFVLNTDTELLTHVNG